MLLLTHDRHFAGRISTKVSDPSGSRTSRLIAGALAAVFSRLTARQAGLYLAMTVPGAKGDGIKREYGADDPKGIQDRGCPRNCKRIAVHPRGAERRHATAPISAREGRWATDIRKPGDLPSNIDPSSRAGMPEEEKDMTIIALLRIVFPESPLSLGRPGALTAS
jgi:hypothetical protein